MRRQAQRAALLAVWVLGIPHGVSAQLSPTDTVRRSVVTEKTAYVALPPELVAEPVVTQLSVSSGGHYALAQRLKLQITPDLLKPETFLHARPPGEVSLILWDSRAHLSTTVWRGDANEMHIDRLVWMPKAEVAYAVVEQDLQLPPNAPPNEPRSRQILLRIAPISGRAETIELGNQANADWLELTPSPTLPLMAVKASHFMNGEQTVSLALLDERGQFGAHAEASYGRNGKSLKGATFSDVTWSETGQPLIRVTQWKDDGKAATVAWASMDVKTGDLSPLANGPQKPQDRPANEAKPRPAPSLPLRLKSVRVGVKEGETTQSTGMLWLESVAKSEQPRMLLSSDSTGGELMARGEMALYQSQGAVWAVPLLPIDRATFLVMKQQAERVATMNKAKQAGLALLMFAEDNDETLPNSDNLANNLAPYLGDSSVLDGFNYTYPGGPLSDIASPAETVIGSMNGPGGKAIIYADGHVRWQ
jgi:hypothetical protein